MIPNNGFTPTPLPGEYYPPDTFPYSPLYEIVWGGTALNNGTNGRQVQYWIVWYDIATNQINVAPTATGVIELQLYAENVSSVSLAFDTNMSPIVAYMTGTSANLYHYDTISEQYITETWDNIQSCRVAIDDMAPFYAGQSDAIFAYVQYNQLYYRQQRDRYTIVRLIGPVTNSKYSILKIGLAKTNRLQFLLNTVNPSWTHYPEVLIADEESIFSCVIPHPVYSVTWDFGDNTEPTVILNPAEDNTVKHYFIDSGRFKVTCTYRLTATSAPISNYDYFDVQPNPQYIDIKVDKLTASQFDHIATKNVRNAIPMKWYDDGNSPNRTIRMWPIPTQDQTAKLWLWQPLADIASIDEEIDLPPGYERALRFALAKELAPEFGKTVSPQVASIANAAKSTIKRLNSRPRTMRTTAQIEKGKEGVFNYILGDTINNNQGNI